jgi:DNA helicase-2/ATP-dependent DNA helicase PcrA
VAASRAIRALSNVLFKGVSVSLDHLNSAQRAAVTADDGPALVLAGAGTGKTRVIVERLVWLIEEQGVDPRNLLALTFTNKAAAEMRNRVAARLGVDRLAAWIGTFHSFGLFILRREMETLGRPKAFTIFDDADQLSLLKRLVKDLPKSFEPVSPREALSWISRLKQNVATPDPSVPEGSAEEHTYRELWHRYHNALRHSAAVDFDDLLVLVAELFEKHPDALAKYQRRYRHVLIDEYQDTNHAQYVIARKLSQDHGNLFVVGDEDQSIYSWRGADLRNILDFSRDFSGAQVYRLEQNYRCTQPILDAANAVVAHNASRLGKTLWSATKTGAPVRLYRAEDGDDEARFIAEEIAASGEAGWNVAVLYRTVSQSRAIEHALIRKNLAYVVVGGVKFYERKETKDLLAYLRLVVNPRDDLSLRRVLNTPPRGIGGVTLERIDEYAVARNVPLLEVLRDVEHDQTLSQRARQSAAEFVHLIDDLALLAREKTVKPVVEQLLERTSYRDFIQKQDEQDFRTRWEIIDEFVSSCALHDEDSGAGLEAFLQDLALVTDLDNYDSGTPAISLLTCHSAKGLEFDCVYLVGLEEGLLPHASAFEDEDEIEEERRLCYVAMTRARKALTLAAARARVQYGQRRENALSRFVGEIPSDRLQVVGREQQAIPPRAAVPTAAVEKVKMGTQVRHPSFGKGTVMYTSGSGNKLRARIRFETGRTREFMVSMAPLEILEGNKR